MSDPVISVAEPKLTIEYEVIRNMGTPDEYTEEPVVIEAEVEDKEALSLWLKANIAGLEKRREELLAKKHVLDNAVNKDGGHNG